MEITLRQAAKLQTEIALKIKAVNVPSSCELTEYTTDVNASFEAAASEASEKLVDKNILIGILYNIRRKVSKLNDTLGISGLLTDIAEQDALIKSLEEVVAFKVAPADLDETIAKIQKLQTSQDYYERQVVVPIWTKRALLSLQERLLQEKSKRVTHQDELLRLNLTNRITLMDQHVEVLHQAGISV